MREGDRLYGRGTADDGYSVFAALSALEALGRRHPPAPGARAHRGQRGERQPDLAAYLDRPWPRAWPIRPW